MHETTNKDIANFLDAELLGAEHEITNIVSFPNSVSNSISFLNTKNINEVMVEVCKPKCTIIARHDLKTKLVNMGYSVIVSDNPKYDLTNTYNKFFMPKTKYTVHSSAHIGPAVKLDKDVLIGPGVILDGNIQIKSKCVIGANTVLKNNVSLENNVTILSGTIIGENAFSFGINNDNKISSRFPSFGGVVIESGVEIGNNCVISRGIFEDTIIKKNACINDLTHIGNSVKIGQNSLIMANVDISARVVIGKNCWISQSVCIRQGISIGNNTQVGMGAVVTKNIASGSVAYGSPAKYVRER